MAKCPATKSAIGSATEWRAMEKLTSYQLRTLIANDPILLTSKRGMGSTIAAAIAAGFLAVSPVLGYWLTSAPARVIVETYSGEVYIAGEGDTCADAWQGAVIPADARDTVCP